MLSSSSFHLMTFNNDTLYGIKAFFAISIDLINDGTLIWLEFCHTLSLGHLFGYILQPLYPEQILRFITVIKSYSWIIYGYKFDTVLIVQPSFLHEFLVRKINKCLFQYR